MALLGVRGGGSKRRYSQVRIRRPVVEEEKNSVRHLLESRQTVTSRTGEGGATGEAWWPW